jgi:hypothetical protein
LSDAVMKFQGYPFSLFFLDAVMKFQGYPFSLFFLCV